MNARARHLPPEHNDPVEESNLTIGHKMTRSQLLISWSVVGMMLLVVFLFGFYSGRRQGIEQALTEQSVPRLRLPVENPRARASLSTRSPATQIAETAPSAQKFDFTESKPDSFATENQAKIDNNAIVPQQKDVAKTDLSAGFVAKAANDIAIQPSTENKELNSTSDSDHQSLAERVAKVELSPALETAPAVEKSAPSQNSEVKAISSTKTTEPKTATIVSSKAIVSDNKTAPTIPVKKPLTTPVKAAPTGLFVQVGAPDSFSKAQTMVSNLKAKGVTAAIRVASVNNKMHYRVLVGPFSSRDSAQSAKNQVMKSGVASGEPFIKNY